MKVVSSEPHEVAIPDRRAFKAAEVCEIAKIQPYVLRSWESEFPDLGVAKSPGGARVYRRADVERVLLIKRLVFGEGLTLSGARRRLDESAGTVTEAGGATSPAEGTSEWILDEAARVRVLRVREGLTELAEMLSHSPSEPEREFVLGAPAETVEEGSAGRRRARRAPRS